MSLTKNLSYAKNEITVQGIKLWVFIPHELIRHVFKKSNLH